MAYRDVPRSPGGPLVLLLHGLPQSRHFWGEQVPALGAAGYRAVAPDQRGDSPGARPDPSDLAAYAVDRLVADVLDLAAGAGDVRREATLGRPDLHALAVLTCRP
ncbi:MAG: alpha/beta fold hydrolase [Candidatus Rokuibacteriota bacterium]